MITHPNKKSNTEDRKNVVIRAVNVKNMAGYFEKLPDVERKKMLSKNVNNVINSHLIDKHFNSKEKKREINNTVNVRSMSGYWNRLSASQSGNVKSLIKNIGRKNEINNTIDNTVKVKKLVGFSNRISDSQVGDVRNLKKNTDIKNAINNINVKNIIGLSNGLSASQVDNSLINLVKGLKNVDPDNGKSYNANSITTKRAIKKGNDSGMNI